MTVINRQMRRKISRDKSTKFRDPLEVVCGVIEVYSVSQGIEFRDAIDRVLDFKFGSNKEDDQYGHRTDV